MLCSTNRDTFSTRLESAGRKLSGRPSGIAARVADTHRQIGRDIADYGIHDTNIIPLLHRLKKATLFTQDKDFFKQNLCHSAYCLAWIDGKPGEAALYLRRFLRHRQFATQAKRMGVVARVSRVFAGSLRNLRKSGRLRSQSYELPSIGGTMDGGEQEG